jgi:CBS domain-containing protein
LQSRRPQARRAEDIGKPAIAGIPQQDERSPVVDGQERLIGVVTVDDVLALLLPGGWRRRFDLLGDN